jgi:hypothetical protein
MKRMKRTVIFSFALIFVFLFSGCVTTSSDAANGKPHGETEKADATNKDGSGEKTTDVKRAFQEMQAYFENAQKKMDEMTVAEAVNQYVAVLAIKAGIGNPSKEILELAKKAETELTKIEAGFLLMAGAEWLDANGNQIAGSSFTVGKGDSLNPKITLWYNVGGSRIAVSAVPVIFEFIKGSGLLTGYLRTNEYGEASVPLAKIDNPNKETVIRASVVYTVKGYTYRFAQTKLEFVYLPPSKRATILVFERGPQYVAEDPYIFNTVYNSLKKMEFDFIPFNGKLIQNDFMTVFGGDFSSIKKLTLEQNVPYLIVVLNDCYSVRKVEELKAYIGEGKATLRVIRIADGKILFETVGYADKMHDTHGQGSSLDKTMRDVFRRAAKELETGLAKQEKEINKALGIE